MGSDAFILGGFGNSLMETKITKKPILINEEASLLIDKITENLEHNDLLKKHKLDVPNKILFHGEPGNGKTSLTNYLAGLLEIPLYTFSGDIVDSHLGSTSKNIIDIFKKISYVKDDKIIVFLDELDSIGRKRDGEENGVSKESTRILNTLLLELDKISNNIIFIAATNRKDTLDPALIRRFSYQLELKAPSMAMKKEYIKTFCKYHKIKQTLFKEESLKDYKNFAMLEHMLIDKARQFIIKENNKKDNV